MWSNTLLFPALGDRARQIGSVATSVAYLINSMSSRDPVSKTNKMYGTIIYETPMTTKCQAPEAKELSCMISPGYCLERVPRPPHGRCGRERTVSLHGEIKSYASEEGHLNEIPH